MTTGNKTATISFVNPTILKPHPKNTQIYGDDDEYQSLVESIKELGVLTPLSIKKDMTIISGHRRWRAATAAGCTTVPVTFVEFVDELEENLALLDFNRHREKNGRQMLNEGDEFERIYAEQAERRKAQAAGQPRGVKQEPSVTETFREETKIIDRHSRETSSRIAETIGLGSGKQWEKIQYINKHKPELLASISNDNSGKTINQVYVTLRREQKGIEERLKISNTHPPDGKYQVLVIDPPWQYDNRQNDPSHQISSPYQTMTIDAIKQLPIPAADDSILWLWTPNAFLPDAFQILTAWGFTYRTCLTWGKNFVGLGDWLGGQTEHCLLATKGNYKVSRYNESTLLTAPRTQHSEKPDSFYEMVVKLCPGTRIDMFARKDHDGFTAWGAETV